MPLWDGAQKCENYTIRSFSHDMYTPKITEKSSNAFDDRRSYTNTIGSEPWDQQCSLCKHYFVNK